MSFLLLHPMVGSPSTITPSLMQYFSLPPTDQTPHQIQTITFWTLAHRIQTNPPTQTQTLTLSISSPPSSLPANFATDDGCQSLIAFDAATSSSSLISIDFNSPSSVSSSLALLSQLLSPPPLPLPPPSDVSSLTSSFSSWAITSARKISSVTISTVKTLGSLADLVDNEDNDNEDDDDVVDDHHPHHHHHHIPSDEIPDLLTPKKKKTNSNLNKSGDFVNVPLLKDILDSLVRGFLQLQQLCAAPTPTPTPDNDFPSLYAASFSSSSITFNNQIPLFHSSSSFTFSSFITYCLTSDSLSLFSTTFASLTVPPHIVNYLALALQNYEAKFRVTESLVVYGSSSSTTNATNEDDIILADVNLTSAITLVQSKINSLSNLENQTKSKAVLAKKANNPSLALLLLKRSKLYSAEILKLSTQVENLHLSLGALRSLQTNAKLVEVFKLAKDGLAAAREGLTVEDVDDVMIDLKEELDEAAAIDNAMKGGVEGEVGFGGEFDEEELMEELRMATVGAGGIAEDEKAVEVVAEVEVEAEAEVEEETKTKADVFPSLGGVPPSLGLEAKEKGEEEEEEEENVLVPAAA